MEENHEPQPAQFSIAAALFAMVGFAILFAIMRGDGAYALTRIVPAIGCVMAFLVAYYKRASAIAWGILAIGFLVTLLNLTNAFVDCFYVLGDTTPGEEIQVALRHTYFTDLALLGFLLLPAVYVFFKRPGGKRVRIQKWVVAGVIVALVDSTLTTVYLVVLIEYGI